MVPHLVTALNGPLLDLEQKILEATPAIERWFRLEWQEHTPPFYCTANLRNAGFKLAAVGTHLFPGSFNHLPQEVMPLAVQATMAAIEKICPDAKNLLIIPSRGERDLSYLENIARLAAIMRQAGLNVRFGTLDESVLEPVTLTLADGQNIVLEPLERSPRRLGLKNFDPCSILLNDVLDTGVPEALRNLHEQYLLPPLHASQSARRLATHFACYDEVAKKFAKMAEIDPWMVSPYFAHVKSAAVKSRGKTSDLADAVDGVLKKIARKYREYGIAERPYVVVKSNAGVGDVLSLRDAEQAERWRQSTGISAEEDLIVQEGVYTFERMGEKSDRGDRGEGGEVAEPVVFMIDRYVVGGFYRTHRDRERDQSLNVPGVRYVPLGFEHTALPDAHTRAAPPNRFYLYGVVARLGLLAASIELERSDPEAIQV